MKHYVIVILFFFSASCFSQDKNKDKIEETNNSEMTFKKTFHNFKTVWYKADATYEFVFKNTGKEPLIITKVKSSCGCTIPTWEKEPVLKNKTGIIKVKYDSKRIGQFQKSIKVYSNAKNSPVELIISGEVKVTD